jgi:hypothetical protein
MTIQNVYPPFPLSREIFQVLNDQAQLCDSFDQLTKVALLGDFLLDPTSHYHKVLFTHLEFLCRKLRGLPNNDDARSPYPCKCWPDCEPGFEVPF